MLRINLVYGYCFNDQETDYQTEFGYITGWDLIHNKLMTLIEEYPNYELKIVGNPGKNGSNYCLILKNYGNSNGHDYIKIPINDMEYSNISSEYCELLKKCGLDYTKYCPQFLAINA